VYICNRLKFLLIIFLGLLGFGLTTNAAPIGDKPSKQVLVIDLPRLTFDDLTPRYPNLFKLANESAVGVLTARISGAVVPEKLYLNLSSGQQLWSIDDSRLILNSSEIYNGLPAGKLYRSLTGYQAQSNGAVYLGLPRVMQFNFKKETAPNIGGIGNTLRGNGIKTAVIGNADTREYLNRSGAIPWVDSAGIVDLAAVGPETTLTDPAFPSGLRSNCDRIWAYWRRFSGKAQVVSVNLGDLERIERYRDYLTEARWRYFRNQALLRYDRLIGTLLADLDPTRSMTVLYSIMAPEIEGRTQRLNPALVKSIGLKPGLILSNTTRRVALITGPDLIAAIFSFLELKNQEVYNGRTIRSLTGNWPQAATILNELDLNYQARWILLPVYGYALIITVLTTILGLIFLPGQRRFFVILQWVYLFLLTIPAVFLIEALVNPIEWPAIIAWTIGLAGAFLLLIGWYARRDQERTLLAIAVVTALIIGLDGLNNGWLELRSFWGYSAATAARFYGVGNEYLGFLLGAYIVAVTLSLAKFRRYQAQFLWGAWLILALFLFYPVFGANIGGGITVILGLGMTNFIWLGQPITKKRIGLLLLALVGVVTLIGTGDILIYGREMSHFGQFISLIRKQGLPIVIELLGRKWQLNLNLITTTGWSYVLIGLLAAVPLLYKRPPQIMADWIGKYPTIAKGLLGSIITSVVALLTNDSGIVTAATVLIFGIDLMFISIIKEMTPHE
jgi:hypothetical protein